MSDNVAVSLGHLVAQLGGDLYGDPQTLIAQIRSLEEADEGDISFLSHPKYTSQLQKSKAACVIVSPALHSLAVERGACIVSPDPYLYFAKLTQWWKQQRINKAAVPTDTEPLIHPSAVVHPLAWVHPSARIGPLCVLERGVRIGPDSILKSRVTVSEDCSVGARCIVHSGVVIGADGFGFAPNAQGWEKIEQLGAVSIGNDVEIGANTCIDRGALNDTVIEDGAKLDNLIQIGHNVRVGKHVAMAGCVGIAGSAVIGAHCTIGGGAVVLGHLSLADGVHISAGTVVTKSINQPGQYTGIFPMDTNAAWERNAATLKQLHSLRDRIKLLEQENKS